MANEQGIEELTEALGDRAGGCDDYGGGILTTTIRKQDDNYFIRLPAYFVERFKIIENEEVYLLEEFNKIVIQKTRPLTVANDNNRKTIEELFADYDDDYEPFSIEWGRPKGREIW